MRYRLVIEYDGGPFAGWQRQPEHQGLTVQGLLERALNVATKQEVLVQSAGRTDAGVHARAMVAHLDLLDGPTPLKLREMLNALVRPHPIAVLDVAPVSSEWHARFSCTGRAYTYVILNRRADPALERGRVWWVQFPLDAEAMDSAAQVLIGKHDFSTFRAAECQAASPIKTLDRLQVRRDGERVLIEAEARSFLHHQVRNLVGTLTLVGRGKWSASDLRAALEARNRAAGGPTAPAQGLYFERATYDEVALAK